MLGLWLLFFYSRFYPDRCNVTLLHCFSSWICMNFSQGEFSNVSRNGLREQMSHQLHLFAWLNAKSLSTIFLLALFWNVFFSSKHFTEQLQSHVSNNSMFITKSSPIVKLFYLGRGIDLPPSSLIKEKKPFFSNSYISRTKWQRYLNWVIILRFLGELKFKPIFEQVPPRAQENAWGQICPPSPPGCKRSKKCWVL